MEEAKNVLTKRLRREGRWEEASLFKDEVKNWLRASGLKRAEANEKAWDEMAEKYPPLPEPELPAEPESVEKPPEEAEPAGPVKADFEQARVRLSEELDWAHQNWALTDVEPKDAPSQGAWSFLLMACSDTKGFYALWQRCNMRDSDDESQEFEDDARHSVAEINKRIEEIRSAALRTCADDSAGELALAGTGAEAQGNKKRRG